MDLITGTSGHFGRLAVEFYLQKNSSQPLAILSRDSEKVKDLAEKGAEVRIGDYNDPSSLVKAFKGIEKVLFISSNDLSSREIHHKNVINAAKEAGVKHLTFTSFQFKSTSPDSVNALMPVYLATEEYLKQSGLNYTILRNGIYLELLPDIIGPAVHENKTLYAPAADTPVAFTARQDLAEAAINVLLSNEYNNQTISLTNTDAVTFAQVANILSKVLEVDVQYVDPSEEEYQQALKGAGLPDEVVGLFASILASIKAGEFDRTTPDLAHILGRQPLSAEKYLTDFYKK